MRIIPLGSGRMRVLLAASELEQLGLHDRPPDPAHPGWRWLLHTLRKAADALTDFPTASELLVKVCIREDGDCMIEMDAHPPVSHRWRLRRPHLRPVIYRFSDIDALIDASVRLFRRCSHRIRESALYRADGEFWLLLDPLDAHETLSLHFLDEYAERWGAGALAAARLYEHGQPMVAQDALGLLAAYFG